MTVIKTSQIVTFVHHNDIVVERAALVQLLAAHRDPGRIRQSLLQPTTDAGTRFFHRGTDIYVIPNPIKQVQQDSVFHVCFVTPLH